MIIYTFIGLILEILLAILYINSNIENLSRANKITKASLRKLKIIKSTLFIICSITILVFWVSILNFSVSKIMISIGLLIIDLIIFLVYKRKIKKYILLNKKKKSIKKVHTKREKNRI